MKTAVVILNWNGKGFLEKFLPSVSQNSKGADLWVIDNASTDDSVAFIKSDYPSIKIVENEANGGFAKGYNDGLKHIEADIYVLLNSDVEVTKNWLNPILDLMKADPSIAACQPKVKAFHNKNIFEHAGAAGGFMDKHGYTFCRGRIFNQTEDDRGQYNDSREIFWATGACMFIRSEDYHRQAGLDEDFFAHMEEIDLCWRLKNEGRKIWYCSESTVYHVGGGTLTYASPKKTFLNFRNNLFTIAKNYRAGNLFIKIWWRLCLDGIAAIKFLFAFQFSHIFAVAKAHITFYLKLGSMLRKRKELGKNLNINNTGTYDGGIVWQAFAKGNKTFNDLE